MSCNFQLSIYAYAYAPPTLFCPLFLSLAPELANMLSRPTLGSQQELLQNLQKETPEKSPNFLICNFLT